MLIDCATCLAPEHACTDCVVTVLLGTATPAEPPPHDAAGQAASEVAAHPLAGPVELDDAEQRALAQLSAAGLVPPLRLVAGAGADGAPDARRGTRHIA